MTRTAVLQLVRDGAALDHAKIAPKSKVSTHLFVLHATITAVLQLVRDGVALDHVKIVQTSKVSTILATSKRDFYNVYIFKVTYARHPNQAATYVVFLAAPNAGAAYMLRKTCMLSGSRSYRNPSMPHAVPHLRSVVACENVTLGLTIRPSTGSVVCGVSLRASRHFPNWGDHSRGESLTK